MDRNSFKSIKHSDKVCQSTAIENDRCLLSYYAYASFFLLLSVFNLTARQIFFSSASNQFGFYVEIFMKSDFFSLLILKRWINWDSFIWLANGSILVLPKQVKLFHYRCNSKPKRGFITPFFSHAI